MAAPWEKDAVATTPPAEAQPWDNDRGVEGSGGYEDRPDVPDDGALPDRTPDGRLIVNIHGDASPYEVAGTPEGSGAATARGVMDTLTFGGANRLFAGLEGAEEAMNGGDFSQKYNDRLKQFQDVMHADEAGHPIARITGQLLGGLAIPAGLEGVGLRAGTSVLRAGGSIQEARAAVSVAVRNRMAAMGGAGGAAHGALSSDDLGSVDALENAATEGALGAAGGLALGAGGQALASRMEAARVARRALPLTDAQRYLAATDRAGVEPFAADVGGPTTKRLVAGVAQTPFGAKPIADAADATLSTAQAARDRVASAIGQALDPEAAGENIRTGIDKAINSTRQEARSFYAPAERATQGVKLDVPKALAELEANLAELSENPAADDAVSALSTLRDKLASGGITVRGIRGMRTSLRDQFIKDGLRGSDVERRVNKVVDAAAQDVAAGLVDQGLGDAASNFRQGDTLWKNRVKLIDDVFTPIVGKKGEKSGEAIVKSLTADLQGNNARAVKLLNSLPEEEANNARASIIAGLGHPNPGAQDATGGGLSLAKFLTDYNKIGETAKRAYFGAENRSALNDLAFIAERAKGAQKYAGHSNTGAINSANLTSGGLGGAVIALLTGHPLVAAAAASPAAYQAVTSRVLASPRFVRWLARAPKTQLSAPAYLDRLSRIARAEPAIANDLGQLQAHLSSMIHGASQSAAAQPESLSSQKGYMGFSYAQPGSADTNEQTWDKRADGSSKGHGFLGLLQRPGGGVSSEISIGVDGSEVGSKQAEVEIPTMVPTLTKDELNALLTKPEEWVARSKDPVARSITQKARDYARHRIAMGLNPFAQSGESPGSQDTK